jgi:predicted DNA-binding mobile mystery protein A
MQRNERATQARREIDRRFRDADVKLVRPRSGWIRAIRGALGMSQQALSSRLGISREAVAKLERAELGGGITIAKLSEVAGALDCTLVYALVPNTSLEDTVQRQARRIAAERLGYVATTMALEDQEIGAERRDEHLETYARGLVARNDLWRAG